MTKLPLSLTASRIFTRSLLLQVPQWRLAPYRISKAGVNALVGNLAHETGRGSRGLWVDAIWLATREFNAGDQTGVLWEDREVVPW